MVLEDAKFVDSIKFRIKQIENYLRVLDLFERKLPAKFCELSGNLGAGGACISTILMRQLNFEIGKLDRLTNVCCRSANGIYLNGWYYEQFGHVFSWYYVTSGTINLLDQLVSDTRCIE